MDELRLIDLPGYGYAKVSQADRNGWQPLIEGYTRTRRALALFVVLIDARRGIEDEERQLYEWLGTENVPAQIVFTKVDKLSASARGLLRERARASFRGRRPFAGPLMVSGADRRGCRRAVGGDLRRRPGMAAAQPRSRRRTCDPEVADPATCGDAGLASGGNQQTWRSTSCNTRSTSSR